jgi:hypothetical protein
VAAGSDPSASDPGPLWSAAHCWSSPAIPPPTPRTEPDPALPVTLRPSPSRELPTSATSLACPPGRQRHLILLTGIHAVGSHGIIDFLRRELADLYEQVDLQPFSSLIATEYDPITRKLVRSERIAPLYRHQEP